MTTNEEKTMPDVIYAQQHPSADPTDVDAYTFKFEGATKYIRSEIAEELANALVKLRLIKHDECEDRWYSCPLSEDGCANDTLEIECTCGLDDHNKIIDETLQKYKQMKGE